MKMSIWWLVQLVVFGLIVMGLQRYLADRAEQKRLESSRPLIEGEIDTPSAAYDSRVQEIDGRTYVRIENGWYLKRADNTYNTNGVQTYFALDRKPAALSQKTTGSTSQHSITNLDKKASQIIENVVESPLSAYGPGQIGELLSVVDLSKKKQQERESQLNEITKESSVHK